MKVLRVLPAEVSSNNTFTFHGSTCHLYMVDTELNLIDENWFINSMGHVNCMGYCDADQIYTGDKNEVIIASTDFNLGLEPISKDMVNMFIQFDGLFDIVSYFTTLEGELDWTLQADLKNMSQEKLDLFFI